MHITTDAIVLRERAVDEFDSVLTLLCKECGIITAFARGAKKPRTALRVNAELLSYSCFVLFENKGRYAVDKADLNRAFMGVRGDLEKLSLASYFCQLTTELAPHEQPAADYLRLLLNCLHLLDTGKRDLAFLKPLYELRLISMAGFMPNLVGCKVCGRFDAQGMRFLPRTGELCCADCAAQGHLPSEQGAMALSVGVLAAMRHILYADFGKLFAFRLAEHSLAELAAVAEFYCMTQTEKRFDTLDFYLSLAGQTSALRGKTDG